MIVIPMSNVTCNNKTVGYYQLYKDKGSDDADNIIIPLSGLVLEGSQSILPDFPDLFNVDHTTLGSQ